MPRSARKACASASGSSRSSASIFAFSGMHSVPRSCANPRSRLDLLRLAALVDVGDVEGRLGGQQVDRRRDLDRARAGRLSVLEPGAQAFERLVLGGRGLLAALGGLGDALAPALDRGEVGEHELELDRVGVVERVDPARRMGDGLVVEDAQRRARPRRRFGSCRGTGCRALRRATRRARAPRCQPPRASRGRSCPSASSRPRRARRAAGRARRPLRARSRWSRTCAGRPPRRRPQAR